jgi:hypothetical protein
VLDEPSAWTRTWIVQEVALAREVQVIYGSHIFQWELLLLIYFVHLKILANSPVRPDLGHILGGRGAYTILQLRADLLSQKTRSLLWLWDKFGEYAASDGRDKIFAMLALAKDNLGIYPDYTTIPEKLYCDIGKQYICHTGNLYIVELPLVYFHQP